MDNILRLYDDFMARHADPRVQHWNMMKTPGPTLFVVLVYLLSLIFLTAYMKNRKPYNLTKVVRYYNIFQVLSCAGLIYMISTTGWTSGENSFTCQPIDYSENPKAMRLLGAFYMAYYLKMIELVETMFFILRKKFNQVTGLHIYHHISTFVLAYIGCRFLGGGMLAIPVMLNCFIHVLMYMYYYLSTFGPKWQKVLANWKPKLTLMQMIQFVIMVIHSMSVFLPSCPVPKKFLLFYLPNIAILFKMFYNFYTKSYNADKQERKTIKKMF